MLRGSIPLDQAILVGATPKRVSSVVGTAGFIAGTIASAVLYGFLAVFFVLPFIGRIVKIGAELEARFREWEKPSV